MLQVGSDKKSFPGQESSIPLMAVRQIEVKCTKL